MTRPNFGRRRFSKLWDVARKLTLSRRGLLRLAGLPVLAACGGGSGVGAPGSNKNIDHDILTTDADGYNGMWSGDWVVGGVTLGTVSANVTIDPDARTLTVVLTVTGDITQDGIAIPPLTVEGSVDSYVYTDDGMFSIHKQTALGSATISNGGQIGSGLFHLRLTAIIGHPDISSFDAQGVANLADEIPTTFTLSRANGTQVQGSIHFTH